MSLRRGKHAPKRCTGGEPACVPPVRVVTGAPVVSTKWMCR
jgi:hypothetical protein